MQWGEQMQSTGQQPHVGLLVTCLVDAMRPQIGFAAIHLLELAGCRVSVPMQQTCCGQPAQNSGDQLAAERLARAVVDAFERFDYIVVPSGSCGSTIKLHYPAILAGDAAYAARARSMATKTYEIMSFLVDVMDFRPKNLRLSACATYHDSCAGLRELGIHAAPRRLLAEVADLTLVPLEGAEVCCGFGGTFAVKYPVISEAIVTDKAAAIRRTGADLLLGGDLSCLINMAGRLHRLGGNQRAFHAIEVLAGMSDGPAIGEPDRSA
ncbi:(Fe-S)-binding protein [Acidiphilium sp.]|uniref:(Fe-S)-binding protein n=1 Tax=Acidiphilium sp. TaxID=527 RepID=UPI003D007A04